MRPARRSAVTPRETIPVRPHAEDLPTGRLYRHPGADALRRVANLCLSCKLATDCVMYGAIVGQETFGVRTMITSCRSWEDRRE